MKISISTVSEDKLFLRFTGFPANSEKLNKAIDKIKGRCFVQVKKLVGSQIIALERKSSDIDLHIAAGTLLMEIRG